jgi:hypothetical protein
MRRKLRSEGLTVTYIDLVRKQHQETYRLRQEVKRLKKLTQTLARDAATHLAEVERLHRERIDREVSEGKL